MVLKVLEKEQEIQDGGAEMAAIFRNREVFPTVSVVLCHVVYVKRNNLGCTIYPPRFVVKAFVQEGPLLPSQSLGTLKKPSLYCATFYISRSLSC